MEFDSVRALAWLARRRHARTLEGPAHRRPRVALEGVRLGRLAALAVLLTVNFAAVWFALTRSRFDGAAVLALLVTLVTLRYAMRMAERLR